MFGSTRLMDLNPKTQCHSRWLLSFCNRTFLIARFMLRYVRKDNGHVIDQSLYSNSYGVVMMIFFPFFYFPTSWLFPASFNAWISFQLSSSLFFLLSTLSGYNFISWKLRHRIENTPLLLNDWIPSMTLERGCL